MLVTFTNNVIKRIKKRILIEIFIIDGQLEPDTLSCGGNLPKRYVTRLYEALRRKRKALVQKLGYEPLDTDLKLSVDDAIKKYLL